MRQLVSGGLLPADAPVSGRGSVAPAGESLQLRLHAGGERRAGLPRHQPAAGVQQPGQAERGGPRAAGGVQRGPGPGGRAASREPCHQESLAAMLTPYILRRLGRSAPAEVHRTVNHGLSVKHVGLCESSKFSRASNDYERTIIEIKQCLILIG